MKMNLKGNHFHINVHTKIQFDTGKTQLGKRPFLKLDSTLLHHQDLFHLILTLQNGQNKTSICVEP